MNDFIIVDRAEFEAFVDRYCYDPVKSKNLLTNRPIEAVAWMTERGEIGPGKPERSEIPLYRIDERK